MKKKSKYWSEYQRVKRTARHTGIPDPYLENVDWFKAMCDCDCKPNGELNG